jgi:broad specificity phosphatase PhoE
LLDTHCPKWSSIVHYVMTRHAEAVANQMGTHLGFDEPLSEFGLRQADALAARLAGDHFDVLVHSGSLRTQQTAAPILRSSRVSRTVVDPRLIEGSVGLWAHDKSSIRADVARDTGQPIWEVRPPEGESYLDIDERMQPVIADIRSGAFGDEVLIVGHGRVNSIILRSLQDIAWEDYDSEQMFHASVTEFDIVGDAISFSALEDVSHLPPEVVTR